MITNGAFKTIIFILFELTITILLVIQLYLLVKEFALPFLRKKITLLNKLWTDFQSQIELLSKTKKSLNKKIDEQADTIENLEKKIESWHSKLKEKQEVNKIVHAQLIKSIRQKRERQYQRIQKAKIEEKLVPEAIAQARQELERLCAGNKGKEFLKKVISDL